MDATYKSDVRPISGVTESTSYYGRGSGAGTAGRPESGATWAGSQRELLLVPPYQQQQQAPRRFESWIIRPRRAVEGSSRRRRRLRLDAVPPASRTSRLQRLLGLSPVEARSNLHETMFVVPRPSLSAVDTTTSATVCDRAMAPTPDPGCSGTMGMGRGLFPRLLEMITTPGKSRKGKARAVYDVDGELLPLDGEEGELIDDEACFLDVRESDGIDIIGLLPPEVALHVLLQLDLDSVVACLGVSHAWRRLAMDDTVWRALFYRQLGWTVNLSRRRAQTIKLWSVRTGELRETLVAHEGSVLCLKVELGPAGSGFMCSGSSDRTVRVWEREGGVWVVRAVLSGHAGGVLDLRMDERWIVSCSKDTLIRVWDRQTLEMHCVLRGHEGPVNAVGLQAGQVVSASGDGTMILWDIETGNRVRTFVGHDKGLACVEFKGDTIISGSNDRKIKVWSASTGECILTLPGHELLVRALAYDAVSGRLVSASYDRTIKVWDLSDCRDGGWKLVREFKNLHDSHIFDVKFDATKIVSTSHDQKILVLDFAYDVDGLLFI
ncbi:hypothetical protein FRC07_009929 [Ceratobasidium sp. 392]|nr:hypothetical protein FRC07_009929 [Ceratobasidium sp. 392]